MTTKRRFYGALRVAVCGNQVSPPLGVSLELLGRNTALARIDNTLPLTL
jgi:glutamyl-tRNA synthetase